MPLNITYIYGLIHPKSKSIYDVRYFGKSNNPKRRLTEHFKAAKSNETAPVYNWIRKLIAKNLKPKLLIIEECAIDQWQDLEKKYISYFREHSNYELLNLLNGGDEPPIPYNWIGRKHTEESKKKMSDVGKIRAIEYNTYKNLQSYRSSEKYLKDKEEQQHKSKERKDEKIRFQKERKKIKIQRTAKRKEFKILIRRLRIDLGILKKKNPLRKLNEIQVKELRELRKTGMSLRKIGSIYKIDHKTVHAILTRESYSEIT
jgi:hypothetical protein